MGRTTTNISRVPFIVDPHTISRNSGRQVDWSLVPDSFRPGSVVVTVGAAGAAQGATTLPVDALPGAVKSGTTLDFGGAKFARTTADAATGATSLSVAALPTALVDNDTATVAGTSKKLLPAGTVVGDKLGSGKIAPRVVTINPAIGILETSAEEGETSAALSGYGVITGGVLYENLLPEATGSPKTLASAVKTELNANGTGFAFEQYGDSRA